MQSKATIERQLEHFKTACATDAAETAIWIKALEWVLGDPAHQAAYNEFIADHEPEKLIDYRYKLTERERLLELCISHLLDRLR